MQLAQVELPSKNRVDSVGSKFRKNQATLMDIYEFESWRGAHLWVINTFQVNLRRNAKTILNNSEIIVATRLKRRETIFNKLRRHNSMRLSSMHDIAGCRVIFPSYDDLNNFRDVLLKARWKHVLDSRNSGVDKFDYIKEPKDNGYRGIHDVYQYDVKSALGKRYNGLKIEIQYRTVFQHAWATAVEVSGLLTKEKPKFGEGDPDYIEFFALSSELISRFHEKQSSCRPNVTPADLCDQLIILNQKTKIIEMFERINYSSTRKLKHGKHNILILSSDVNGLFSTTIKAFDAYPKAVDAYNKIEKSKNDNDDVVLVRADDVANIKNAFRNYFADTNDFVRYLREAVLGLSNGTRVL